MRTGTYTFEECPLACLVFDQYLSGFGAWRHDALKLDQTICCAVFPPQCAYSKTFPRKTRDRIEPYYIGIKHELIKHLLSIKHYY